MHHPKSPTLHRLRNSSHPPANLRCAALGRVEWSTHQQSGHPTFQFPGQPSGASQPRINTPCQPDQHRARLFGTSQCQLQRAIPTFVLTMTMTMTVYNASQGFRINSDLMPTFLHPTVQDLYRRASNPHSLLLKRYELLLPHITIVASGPSCPSAEHNNHLLTKVSNVSR